MDETTIECARKAVSVLKRPPAVWVEDEKLYIGGRRRVACSPKKWLIESCLGDYWYAGVTRFGSPEQAIIECVSGIATEQACAAVSDST